MKLEEFIDANGPWQKILVAEEAMLRAKAAKWDNHEKKRRARAERGKQLRAEMNKPLSREAQSWADYQESQR